jgi:hypothetical protein
MHAAVPLALVISLSGTAAAYAFDRQTVELFWESKGVPAHVAQGIADQVGKESGYDAGAVGDGGTSFGLYQHHADRMKALLAAVENEQAFREVLGADPIAAAHWAEIKAAPDRKTASQLWQIYFERPARTRHLSVADSVSAKQVDDPPKPQPAAPPHDWDVFHDDEDEARQVMPAETHKEIATEERPDQ